MKKKLIFTFLALTLLAGMLGYWSMLNNTKNSLEVEKKTIILKDDDNYATVSTSSSLFSPLVVAGLGLTLVASVPISLKILNYNSKKQLNNNKNGLKKEESTFRK